MEKIRSTILSWCQWLINLIFRKSIVAEYGTIKIADLKEKSPWFEKVIYRSMELIEECDPRRYSRVQNELDWIVNMTLSLGVANYRSRDRSCTIDFEEPEEKYAEGEFEYDSLATYYASSIIHEATHGRIFRLAKRHSKDPNIRIREEKLCRKEEERFLKKIGKKYPNLVDSKWIEMDEDRYREIYEMSNNDHSILLFKKLAKQGINKIFPTS